MRDFRGHFSGFLRQVRRGASFAVTARDEVIAIVHPPQPLPRRRPGTLRGQIEMAPDFDAPAPELPAARVGRVFNGEEA